MTNKDYIKYREELITGILAFQLDDTYTRDELEQKVTSCLERIYDNLSMGG